MIWSGARKARFAWALLLALTIGAIVGWVGDQEAKGMLTRGDFPGFWVLGEIVRLGLNSQLYDHELQRQLENQAWPSFAGTFYMSVYPAYDAIFFYPFAALGPVLGRHAWTIVSLGAFYGACRLFFSGMPDALFRSVLLLASAPVFCGVIGAQNTALSMLLYGVLWQSLRDPITAGKEYRAGGAVGLWMIKPQFAAFAGLYLLVARRWKALGVVIGMGVLLYVAGSLVAGWEWPQTWLAALARFSDQNFISNSHNQVSLMGGTKALMLHTAAETMRIGTALAAVISLIVLATFLRITNRVWSGSAKEITSRETSLLLLGPTICLVSPQTLFYDLGFALLPFWRLLPLSTDRQTWGALLGVAALGILTYYRELSHLPVIMPVTIIVYFIVSRARAGDTERPSTVISRGN